MLFSLQARVVTGSHDRTLRLWDGDSGRELLRVEEAHQRRYEHPRHRTQYRNDQQQFFVRAAFILGAQTRTDAQDFSKVSTVEWWWGWIEGDHVLQNYFCLIRLTHWLPGCLACR